MENKKKKSKGFNGTFDLVIRKAALTNSKEFGATINLTDYCMKQLHAYD
jgi:hypothetical protein